MSDSNPPEAGAEAHGEQEGPATPRPGSLAAAGPTAWLALATAALIALALLWSAGEAHYRNCVSAVDLRTQGPPNDLTRLVRNDAVKRCHRLPF